jgi:hypothetical protein
MDNKQYIVSQDTVNKLFAVLKQFPWETAEMVFSIIRSEFKEVPESKEEKE